MARVGLPLPVSPDEVRSATQWWTYRNTKARKQLGFEPRPHEETLEDAVGWQMEQLGDRVRTRRGPPGGGPRGLRPAAARWAGGCSDDERGAARPLPLPHARPTCSARAGRSRGGCASSGSSTAPSAFPAARGRPEIEELTGQKRVPVLVDGDEVIHDSKRILQYLEWKHRKDARRRVSAPRLTARPPYTI